jgi:hypothetical protein
MKRHPLVRQADDAGAALIMVLGFILLISAITSGLLGYISNSVRGRVALDTVRAREYAADAGVEYAISQVRGLPNQLIGGHTGRPAEDPCAPAPGYYAHTVNGVTIRIDCLNAFDTAASGGNNVQQRNVIFAACLQTGAPCTGATPIVRAQVNFEAGAAPVSADPTKKLVITRTYVQSWSVNG